MPHSQVPLCVDLDGTLVRSDLLAESALALLRRNPLYLFAMLAWLLRGRAVLKREIALRVRIEPEELPYDPRVLALVREADGRPRVLCSASDQVLVDAVAAHCGFDVALGSDGRTNLSGTRKARALVERFGERGFDYAGNEAVDLAVWSHARGAIVVDAPDRIVRAACAMHPDARVLPRSRGNWRRWLAALRAHQWPKNLLVFVPMLAAHRLFDAAAAGHALLAFAAFCLCASSAYVLNDLLDLDADRQHPRKRNRPFASGALPIAHGIVASPLLATAAFAIAVALPRGFLPWLAAYGVATVLYSLVLKRLVVLDVLTLAGLYTLRIVAGGAAIPVPVSGWLLAFSLFLFLGLGLLKRAIELQPLADDARVAGRGYARAHARAVCGSGMGSGLAALVVLALYIESTKSAALYGRPQLLWLLLPLLGCWLVRAWRMATTGRMHDDPLVFALTDRASLALFALSALVVVAAI